MEALLSDSAWQQPSRREGLHLPRPQQSSGTDSCREKHVQEAE